MGTPKIAFKTPPRPPKSLPRRLQDRPRRFQEASRRLQDDHESFAFLMFWDLFSIFGKGSREAGKLGLQDASKTPKIASKTPPRPPKSPPRRLQDRPRRLQDGQDRFQDAIGRCGVFIPTMTSHAQQTPRRHQADLPFS